MIKENGKWVILNGIEMAPSQIPVKITHLYGENPELSIHDQVKVYIYYFKRY